MWGWWSITSRPAGLRAAWGFEMGVELVRSSRHLELALVRDEASAFRFRVEVAGMAVFETNVEAAAQAEYDDLYRERDQPYAERRLADRRHSDAERLAFDRVRRTSAKAARSRGGKGGRGGV